jgi:hypothetical protein
MPYVHLEAKESAKVGGVRLINPTDRKVTIIVEPLRVVEIEYETRNIVATRPPED